MTYLRSYSRHMRSGERLNRAKSDEQASAPEINTREAYPDNSRSVKQRRHQTCPPPAMKSVLGKYKCTIASHIAFSLLAVFLAQKCNHTKNSKGLENLGTEEWSANHPQVSFKV